MSGVVGTILTDLSMAFDCLQLHLILAKLPAYAGRCDSLILMRSYVLKNHQKKKNIHLVCNSWLRTIIGVPQGSILRLFLFPIFFEWWLDPDEFHFKLLGKHKSLKIKIEGFKLESSKSVKLSALTTDPNSTFDSHESYICKMASAKIKRFGRIIRNTLDEKQVKKTASVKIKRLIRIRNTLDEKKVKILYNYFLSQFN